MSGVGFSELIILFLIGLIVLGPERLPRVANQIGSWIGQARRMTRVMKRQLEDELDLEKAPDIRPSRTEGAAFKTEPAAAPANEYDDTFSPAHGPDSLGSGVDDDVYSAATATHHRAPNVKDDVHSDVTATHTRAAVSADTSEPAEARVDSHEADEQKEDVS